MLGVLGPVAVRAHDGWRAGPRQQRLILAVLALQAGQVVPAGELIDAVWEEQPPRFWSRRTDRTAQDMYDQFTDSPRQQRKYARHHGGEWHNE